MPTPTPLVSLTAGFLLASNAAAEWSWQRLDAPGDERAVHAVAFDAERRRLAVGDPGGVAWREREGRWRRRRLRAPVRDLVFDAQGSLWAATAAGLFRVAPDGDVSDESPAPGEAARDVLRVAIADDAVAAATAGGVFVASPSVGWRRAVGPFAAAPARAVALGPGELWSVGEQDLARSPLGGTGGGSQMLPVSVRPLVDVLRVNGVLAVAAERTLAIRTRGRAGWSVLRPELPPGARVRRLVQGAGRLWLLTDRGVLEAPSIEGTWRRTTAPLGATPAFGLAHGGGRVWVAAEDGLWQGEPAVRAVTAGAIPTCDPPVRAVQRAALAHLGLEQGAIRRLQRGVSRRGLLPVVSLRGSRSQEHTLRNELDEVFTSGDLRRLFDRDDDRSSDSELSLTVSWDLGDLLYHPEQIDVSQEARRLIELRSDVLGEVNQLYFQRRAVLAQLRASPPDAEEATRLALRAQELAAGLDGWTNGWFGRAHVAAECSSPR